METAGQILVLLVAVEHIYFLYLEMFLWDKPKGMKVFGLKPEQAKASKTLAANQGLYNGFLAAGLIWGLVHPTAGIGFQIQCFFLSCVIVAGIYGGLTASRSIFVVQALPAMIALVVTLLA